MARPPPKRATAASARAKSSAAHDRGKHDRGALKVTKAVMKKTGDKKLRGQSRRAASLAQAAQTAAARADEWLLTAEAGAMVTEGETERTWRFRQEELAAAVPLAAAAKAKFVLRLPELGPYRASFSHDGVHLLLAGKLGHVALLKWNSASTVCELQLRETVRDACILHNASFFAVAQKDYAYIYDNRGVELHRLAQHPSPLALAFLRRHFLLASSGPRGSLVYQDTSTGKVVAEHRSELGASPLLATNPWNATLAMGHGGGAVTLWTPNLTTPAATVFCHSAPVRCVAFDNEGRYMATSASDGQVKVWDVRKFTPLHAYAVPAPPASLTISQRGMLAVGFSRRVQVWNDALGAKASAPYLNHDVEDGRVESLAFCPYDDVLGIGHAAGYATMMVPGAGEPNFDAFVDNPYANKKQRREQEIRQLLDKLPPNSIALDPNAVAGVRQDAKEFVAENQRRKLELAKGEKRAQMERNEAKKRMKGKNKPTRRARKKQMNVVDEAKDAKRKANAAARKAAAEPEAEEREVPFALRRLVK